MEIIDIKLRDERMGDDDGTQEEKITIFLGCALLWLLVAAAAAAASTKDALYPSSS